MLRLRFQPESCFLFFQRNFLPNSVKITIFFQIAPKLHLIALKSIPLCEYLIEKFRISFKNYEFSGVEFGNGTRTEWTTFMFHSVPIN